MANYLLKKTENLIEKPEGSLNNFDLDHRLIEDPDDPYTTITRKRSFVLQNNDATLNAYRMWLLSRPTDYVRRPGAGGLFFNRLNDYVKFSPENETVVSELIKTKTEERFPLINVIDCEVKCKFDERKWDIRIIVQDKVTDMVMSESFKLNGDYDNDD